VYGIIDYMNHRVQYIFCCLIIITLITNVTLNGVSALSILTPTHVEASQELDNAQADKARLQEELSNLEQEIAKEQANLASQKDTTGSIARNIAALTSQIKLAKLNINAKNLVIKKLGGEITQKNQQINVLQGKISSIQASLAQLIRKDRELDNKSILALILSQDSISDAYGDISNFSALKRSIKQSVDEIRGVKSETEAQKSNLETQKNQQLDAKAQLENAKHQVEVSEAEKQQLLAISKNKEKEYQKILADKAKRRSEILSMLFDLRDVSAIPFGKAYDYAKKAQAATGIRPAFLLAILTQESNLGTDQGSCYVTNMDTGAGVSSKSNKIFANVMKAPRDTVPFLDLTIALGRDPAKTLVSCPIGGSGYGGAMGPAQFIPSTWKLLTNRIATALGIRQPDPWNPQDAFMASALYLTDLGAVNGSYTGERNAACKYYSGRKCDSQKPYNSSYGDSVMKKATNIQQNMIDPLQS
jgi:membrane-bound lytic murein transglycosylase B